MNPERQQSILGIALFVVFAGGVKDDREHERMRSLAETLDMSRVMAMVRGA